MKKIIYSLIAIVSLFCTACNLDLDPVSIVTVESFWKTEDDAKGGLYGIYGRLRTQTNTNLYQWGAGRSDEMTYGIQSPGERDHLFLNTLSEVDAGPDWLRLYSVIHDVNSLIKYVPDIPFTIESERNTILAQAYAMRAYVYFVMVRTWGGVPIVTEPTELFDPSDDSSYVARSEVSEVFKQIKADIETALGYFGDDNSFPTGRCYWSRPATNALKGEVYLWTARVENGGNTDFTTALNALNEVTTCDVTLVPFNQLFGEANKGNQEIIFAVQYQRNQSGNQFGSEMYIRSEDIRLGTQTPGVDLVGDGGGANYWAPSEKLRSCFTADDSRKDVTFTDLYIMSSGAKSRYASVGLKYKGGVNGGERYFCDDVVLYRYADVLLMIAEAKTGLGQDPTAEIRQVRVRAYGETKYNSAYKFINGTQSQNYDAILKERQKELALEGKRWWDLIRFGRVYEFVPTLVGKPVGYLLFPISQESLSLNRKLVQNEAYIR